MKKILIALMVVVCISGFSLGAELTLDDSINLALHDNQAVTAAQKKTEAADAKVSQAFSAYLPELALSANYSRSYSGPMQTIFNGFPITFGIDEPANIKGWQAKFNQNLFTFGKIESSLKIALDAARLAKEELRKTKQDIIYQVSAAYFAVIASQKMIDVAQQSVDMASAHLDQVKSMFDVGILARSNVLRSQVSLSAAQNGLIEAKNGFEIAKARFNNAIGASLKDTFELSKKNIDLILQYNESDYNSLLKEAMDKRPDIRISAIDLSIANNSISMARSQWLPSITAQGNYGWMNSDYSSNAINYSQANWTVAAVAAWTLFDGFDVSNKIKEASANLDSTNASRELVKQNAELDVKQSYLKLIAAKDMIGNSKDEVASAQENFDVATTRFKNGLETNIDILDAQTSLTKAQFDLLSAQFNLVLAKAQIEKATGTSDIR